MTLSKNSEFHKLVKANPINYSPKMKWYSKEEIDTAEEAR